MGGRLQFLVCAFVATTVPALAQTGPQPTTGPGFPGLTVQNPAPNYSTSPSPGFTSTQPTGPSGPYTPIQSSPFPGQTIGGATGFNLGWITLAPNVTGATFRDDNVFATNTNRQSDWGFIIRPEIGFRANPTSNVAVTGGTYVESIDYKHFSSQNQLNGGAGVGVTALVDPNTQIVARAQYIRAHEQAGAGKSQFQSFIHPIAYDQADAAAAINKRWDRWWTSSGYETLWVNYEPGDLSGTAVTQSYRSGNVSRVPVRVGYVVAPQTSVFVEGSGNKRTFEVDSFNSWGYRLVSGLLIEPGPGSRVKGEVNAGYMYQAYSGFGMQTIATFTYGGALAFLIAPNITAVVEGRRDAREASLSAGVNLGTPGDAVSVIQSVGGARVDVQVLPNVVIGGGVTYLQDQYLTAGSDHAWSPLATARWFVNQWFTLGFDYRNVAFSTDVAGSVGYIRNVYVFSGNARF